MPDNLPSGNGQTTATRSVSVVLASDHPALPGGGVGGSDASAANQVTGNTSLASIDTKLTGPVPVTITGSVTLSIDESALASAAKQDTGNTSLASIDAKLKRIAAQGPGAGNATPANSKLFNVAFGAGANVNVDLTTAAYAGLLTAIAAGKMLTLKATTMAWYNWAAASITIAAASTAASNPATQGMPIFDGERSDEQPATTSTWLNVLGGAVGGVLAIGIAEA